MDRAINILNTQKLYDFARNRINLPKDPNEYNILDYPHWALFSTIHLNRVISLEDLENNLSLIEMLPHESALDIRIDDLREIGVIV